MTAVAEAGAAPCDARIARGRPSCAACRAELEQLVVIGAVISTTKITS